MSTMLYTSDDVDFQQNLWLNAFAGAFSANLRRKNTVSNDVNLKYFLEQSRDLMLPTIINHLVRRNALIEGELARRGIPSTTHLVVAMLESIHQFLRGPRSAEGGVLQALATVDAMSVQELADATGFSITYLRNVLNELCDNQLLQVSKRPRDRTLRYSLAPAGRILTQTGTDEDKKLLATDDEIRQARALIKETLSQVTP